MKMLNEKEIQRYYKKQAEKFSTDGRSTISDMNTRNLEIEALLKYIKDNKKVLEIGCGNGYTAKKIIQNKKIDLYGTDISEDLIKIAKKQDLKGSKGKVIFKEGNATKLDFSDALFDVVFTERCLINLITWENQKKSLQEIHRVLKMGGILIMLEAFTDGWQNMNMAREEFGLEAILQPDHNLFFEKNKFFDFIKNKFSFVEEDNFLSSYYFGSRVLYPALLKLSSGGQPHYDSAFNSFFSKMPALGNHSGIKIIILKKINGI
jgi:ubiquinone/menaquinone biosynthesis C-methylase UbiE